MRENRTSGSEGGGTEQSVLPTPILETISKEIVIPSKAEGFTSSVASLVSP